MFDGVLKRRIDPFLNRAVLHLHAGGVSANVVTVLGLALGLAGAGAIASEAYGVGLALILASRLCDGLDGALARRSGATDLGGYLDIVFDFIFYGAVPLGFAAADPGINALPAAVLLMSFYANGSSFLALAIMAEKRRLATAVRGPKSLYFSTGLAEAGETLLVFALACLFPWWFPPIAFVFAGLCFVTCAARIALALAILR